MTKIRVHELAKELGLSSKDMETRIRDLGISIKNYMSTLEEYEVKVVRQSLQTETGSADQAASTEGTQKVLVRRRHQVIRLRKIVAPEVPEVPPVEGVPEEIVSGEAAGPEEVFVPPPAVEIPSPHEMESAGGMAPAAPAPEEAQAPPAESEIPEAFMGEEVASEEEAPSLPEAAGPQAPEPERKRYVKILERPRIVIPPPQPPRQARPPQGPPGRRPQTGTFGRPPAAGAPGRPAQASRPDRERPRGAGETGGPVPAAPLPPPGPSRPQRGRRIVKISEAEGQERRKKGVKRDRGEPLTKILVEEVAVALEPDTAPAQMEFVPGPLATSPRGRRRKAPPAPVSAGTVAPKAGKRKLTIYETIQVGELAQRMGVKVGDVIMKLMGMGVMATANQSIDFDAASLLASEYDYEVERKSVAEDLVQVEEGIGGEPVLRPPVVTVMGHVDHGKTSLLDAIRDADVASGEAGGITQHIGAYHVTLPSGSEVVFLDTPGHEAFTAMRARGAKVTDIVLLVVAADDGVMAQTREAIDHARAAGVPMIVAVNKIDKPGANPDRVKRELADLGLVPEEWGGETIMVPISAKKRIGIEELLEMLALQAEVMDLKAVPDRPARGHVIESRLDKGKGPVATLLVSDGTLRVGDALVCGLHYGRIRAMIDDKGGQLTSAGPAMPVEIQGLSGVPDAGNEFVVLVDEKKAREVAEYRQRKAREIELVKAGRISLENVFERMKEAEVKDLHIIIKTDVQGSSEALADALQKLSTQDVRVNIVRSGIGAIVESDVLLASASNAIVIGFNVRATAQAKALAEMEKVDIRYYDVIYNAIEDVQKAMVGLLAPVFEEKVLGHAEVRQTFHVPKAGTIAGSFVTDGSIQRNAKARLLRDNVVIYTGKIDSLRRFKEDAKEVQTGYECGIGLENFQDIKVGDVIEVYRLEERQAELGEPLRPSEETS